MAKGNRETVDLSGHAQLVVIYLGMRVNRLRGLFTLLGFRRKIRLSVEDEPDGLLVHEPIIYSMFPPHFGMRQYWRDFDSLEKWARSSPHKEWWIEFVKNKKGVGFWHETYFIQGGIESLYDGVPDIGLKQFAPKCAPRGTMFSARRRLKIAGDESIAAPVSEEEIYEGDA